MVVLKVKGGSLLREWDRERQRIIIWESHCCWSVGPIQLLRLPLLVPISARLSLLITSMYTRFMFCFIISFFFFFSKFWFSVCCLGIWRENDRKYGNFIDTCFVMNVWLARWNFGSYELDLFCYSFFVFLYVCYRGSYIFSS